MSPSSLTNLVLLTETNVSMNGACISTSKTTYRLRGFVPNSIIVHAYSTGSIFHHHYWTSQFNTNRSALHVDDDDFVSN